MTYSNTYSSPSSPTNFNPFSGMGMRKGGRPSLFPGSGDGSTLNLDFTTGVLDPRLTFSRASGGTYVGSDGYIYGVDSATSASLAIGTGSKSVTLTATAGVDRRFQVGQTVYFSSGANNMSGLVTAYNASTQVITINATATTGSGSFTSWFVGNASPRFDYSPTNIGEPRGLLVEGSSINYMLQSTTLDPHTTFNMRAIATGSITDPEGTTNKAKIIAADGTTNIHGRYLQVTAGTNTTITVSIFAKKNGYKYLYLADIANSRSAVRFDLDDGSTSNSSGPGFVSASATSYPNGWWRCSMVVNVAASTSYAWSYVGVPTTGATYAAVGATYTGQNTDSDGIYCYGFQVEAGSGASSYVPTGASQVTRNAESCTISGTNFSSWFTQGEGTLYAYSDVIKSNNRNLVARIENAGSTNYIEMGLSAVGYATEAVAYAGGAFTSLGSAYTPVVNVPYKSAYTWSNGRLNLGANGTTPTAVSATLVTDLICIGIGGGFLMTDTYLRNGHIRQLKYYPMVMTNAQLQTLTAP